jgi:hypothetical protein
MPDLSALTESEKSRINDSEWRDFHGYKTLGEAYDAIMGLRFMEEARKTHVVLGPNPFNLADDTEWRDFHGYKSVEEGRRAILGSIAQECANAQGRDVSTLTAFLKEQWPIYFPK